MTHASSTFPIENLTQATQVEGDRPALSWGIRCLHLAIGLLLSPAILLVFLISLIFLAAVSVVQWLESFIYARD